MRAKSAAPDSFPFSFKMPLKAAGQAGEWCLGTSGGRKNIEKKRELLGMCCYCRAGMCHGGGGTGWGWPWSECREWHRVGMAMG